MHTDELDAMGKVAAALQALDEAARSRVIAWVCGALGIASAARPSGSAPASPAADEAGALDGQGFESFADLFHAASPRSEKEKALVAGYWVQHLRGSPSFASQLLNDELKHAGYRVANITDALSQLMAERPALVIQLRKSGSTRQARKIYKITDAGIRKVRELVSNSTDGSE